ncbi:sensor histidine kinase [Actinomadura decatromicini]|uniref:histidine kinase n=1 Tax=Actinomadura decatromicini TaxID=2604572 RepID=A0A5D3F664_9ACTN|nr:HAMP domain-containing sensor histidine kinase [Actinomadura decatromicini]TYK43612.1 HAMP domain-containing histidine kinase [Actinomadura decatromicini]
MTGPRSLWARLTAGLVLLLALSCLAVGIATTTALGRFLVGRLDDQLTASGGRFPASLEHERRKDNDNGPDTRGQASGTFGARLFGRTVTAAAVIRGDSDRAVPLTAADRRALADLPADGRGRSLSLSALDDYRMAAVPGDDGDVLVTGLPLRPAEDTLHRVVLVEVIVFAAVLAAAGIAAAVMVRLTLRPLRRVAATASRITERPLASGQVAMPERVPDTDPRTEVGRVGAALNRMLGHVENALARRQASEERLRRFAADASHELRTPVAAIRGHAELALRTAEPVPPEVTRALGRIEAESVRMADLVDDLLLLARLDAGRPLDTRPVDLTRIVLDATADARATGPRHRWELVLPAQPVTVTGDARSLHQLIANLLANARTHTPPGTHVTVKLTTTGDTVVLDVQDNGPGVPEQLREEIFHRFVRADQGRSRTSGSTGLGLAIVQAVATAHHGHAELADAEHTVFRVVLPRADAGAGAERPDP